MKYKIVYLKDKYVDMVDVYPQLVALLYTHQNNTYETCLLYTSRSMSIVRVEGLNQSRSLLDLIEFDQIQHIDLVAMFACYQGCIGGYYLWSNPFEGSYNIESMMEQYTLSDLKLNDEELSLIHI